MIGLASSPHNIRKRVGQNTSCGLQTMLHHLLPRRRIAYLLKQQILWIKSRLLKKLPLLLLSLRASIPPPLPRGKENFNRLIKLFYNIVYKRSLLKWTRRTFVNNYTYKIIKIYKYVCRFDYGKVFSV